jgi:dienelactone hydrolase
MKRTSLAVAISLVCVAAWASGPDIKCGKAEFSITAAEADVPELYRLESAKFEYEMESIHEARNYKVHAVRFPSPIVSPDPENNTVYAEYFEPEADKPGVKRPGVVVLHILGADFALSRYMAARLAQHGVGALFIKLPYYGERKPKGSDKRFLSIDPERSFLSMKQGVCDVRRAAAWLKCRPDIDPKRIGVSGISLGGIVASVAVAIDPDINEGAFLLAGGDLADILWNMPESRKYKDLWLASGRTKADLETLTRPYDPLTYAHRLKGKRLLMIAGKVDEVIPSSSAEKLWKAAGEPPIVWYDCGHYSAAGYLLPAIRRTARFFAFPGEGG